MELAPRYYFPRDRAEIRADRGIHPDGSAGGPLSISICVIWVREKIMSRIPFCWEEAHAEH